MDTSPEIQQALAIRDYRRLVELLGSEPAETLGPLGRTLRFARNMLALHERDTALATVIENTPTTGRVRIGPARDGSETLMRVGSPTNPLCPAGTPKGEVDRATRLLAELDDRSVSVLVSGVGDGYALGVLAAERADSLGAERPVFVVEPDAEFFRSVLLLHDWSGSGSPLLLERIFLVIGDDWADRLAALLEPDAQLLPPKATLASGPQHAGVVDALSRITETLAAETERRKTRIFRHNLGVCPDDTAGRLTRPGARVLLFTTRFSTVLQHSTRHLAEGFRRTGCETEIVIERDPWRQQTIPSILGVVERFRPDLVVQINHHRHENPGLLPDTVPFVCVVQDNLANLLDGRAGGSMGPTDFAAGSWIRRYALDHGYPPDRCIEIPRLTRAPELPAVHTGGGADILYVSNHSATPVRALDLAAEDLDQAQPEAARIVRACGADLIAHGDDGGVIEDSIELDAFVGESCARHGFTGLAPDTLSILSDRLSVTVNNALYRRAGLRWVARAAEALSLKLVLHGRGWEDNPEFGRFAGGVIDYATALPEATSRARFCMVLEPYHPTQHQRALDTWMWGGLPLIRRRRRDAQQREFDRWIVRLPPDAATLADALGSLGDDADEFERVYHNQLGLHAWDGRGDLIELHRERERRGVGDLNTLPPFYDDIAFSDEEELARVMRTLTDDPDRYAEIRRTQHDWVRPRFSYESGARRLLEQVAANMPGA